MIVVTVWRRHSAKCPHKSNRGYRKCKCRVWLEWGTERKRKAAKTRSWEQGEKIARAMELAYERAALGEKPQVEAITVEQAANSFLDAKTGEGLDKDTLQKHRRTTAVLVSYCRRKSLAYIREITLPHLTAHRAEWDSHLKSKLSRRNNQGRLKEFFRYCRKVATKFKAIAPVFRRLWIMWCDMIRLMGKADKAREVFVCQQVADEINRNDGADYCAVPSELEPPDVLLVSHSGKYPTRSAEVVSTPQDFTIRYDNKNVRNFERKLRLALQEVGFSGYRVSVHWSESAIRFGISDKLICALALITKTRAPNSGSLLLRGVEIYKDSPEVSRIAHYVSIFRLPYPSLEVHSACAWWAPRDGRWIEEAVTIKANKYGSGSFTANLMLVVDGLAYLDWEQMVAFRSGNPPEQIPFAELWVVTMGQAHRLKPSSEAPKAIQPT